MSSGRVGGVLLGIFCICPTAVPHDLRSPGKLVRGEHLSGRPRPECLSEYGDNSTRPVVGYLDGLEVGFSQERSPDVTGVEATWFGIGTIKLGQVIRGDAPVFT